MNLYTLLHDRRYLWGYAALAVLFFLVGAYMEAGAGMKRDRWQALEKENQMLAACKDLPPRKSRRDFFAELFQKDDAESYAALLEETGLTVREMGEEEGSEDSLGKFNKIQLQGTGTFSQIIRGFDIIKSKERWNATELIDLSRRGEELSFTIEITTFQSRGTYEEKKYRTHRSHGDREEPRREDSGRRTGMAAG